MHGVSKIEKLDLQHPGLADDTRKWFSEGTSCQKIVALLGARYQVTVSKTQVARFRCRSWVPEQKLLRLKKLEILAVQEVAREREVKATLAAAAAGETK